MKLMKIQIGKPKEMEWNGQKFESGIFKYPVSHEIKVNERNLEGDGQADLSVHGGLDKAVYAYSLDCLEQWKEKRKIPTDYAYMGENLSFDYLPEDKIFVGDIFALGEVQIQVSEPRFPCFKLAAMYQDNNVLKDFMQVNRPGIYFRVLKTGMIKSGLELKLLHQEKELISVQEMFEFKNKKFDPVMGQKILKIQSLNQKWRKKIEEQLKHI